MEAVKKNWKGLLLCCAIAVPAWFLGDLLPLIGGPVFAILFGMIIAIFWKNKESIRPGVSFTSKRILQAAVVFLGFGMNLSEIMNQGRQSLPIILVTISVSLLTAFILSKVMKIPQKIAVLVGVGSSICGGSAIAATAPVIGAEDEEIAQSISVIFLFNIIAALIFPALGGLLGLSNDGFALFAGTAVNDTSSVTAASAAWDGIHQANTLAMATVVKLTRTLAIIPIVLFLTVYSAKKSGEKMSMKNVRKAFPVFIILFLLASVATTVFSLSPEFTSVMKTLSKFLIVLAMAAIGLNTNIVKLVRSGGRPILMGLTCWVLIAAASLMMQAVLGIV